MDLQDLAEVDIVQRRHTTLVCSNTSCNGVILFSVDIHYGSTALQEQHTNSGVILFSVGTQHGSPATHLAVVDVVQCRHITLICRSTRTPYKQWCDIVHCKHTTLICSSTKV